VHPFGVGFLRAGLLLGLVMPRPGVRAEAPAVRGPEGVRDWKSAGEAFLAETERRKPLDHRAKNVILFVGDGMGVSTVTAARILDGQESGRPGEESRLSFETFPYVALSKTYSWDQQTSDSAPTMTALVTGYKTRGSMLSVDHTTGRGEVDRAAIESRSLETILELAAEHGKATGIVTTARVTHATPAANYAHTAERDWESDADVRAFERARGLPPNRCTVPDIARQLIELPQAVRQSLRVVLGGGRAPFLPATAPDPEDTGRFGEREDGRDLTVEWRATRGPGARFVHDRAGFDQVRGAADHLLGLFSRSHMNYERDRPGDQGGEPSLTEMTERAIEMLSSEPSGFYLQVEAGRIDHAHHEGNPYRALTDTIELSRAVRRAVELTDPNETLIIVTADHSHVFTIGGYAHRGNPILGKVATLAEQDGQPPVLARDGFGLPYTTLGYTNGPGHTAASRSQPAGLKTYPHTSGTFTGCAERPDLTNVDTTSPSFMPESAIPLGSETHAGEDVAVYANGPRAHLVHGVMEQSWVYYVMREAFGF
jgi:alkaline phosphatase